MARTIAVTRRTDGGWRRFTEFPDDDHLRTFDPADQKFVAVALGDPEFPTVLNAVDSHWAEHHAALAAHGLRVEFLCPHHCSPGWRWRRGR